MERLKIVLGVIALFALSCNATTVWHWSGGGDGVGDFETPSSWGEGSVPGVTNFLVVQHLRGAT
ncbi:MAG: hypothetical protein PF904_00670 [Kiritimatiellae bacterium]|jgi:hypothetical protein|nr:hypothetical protein [Kiritimatiellia bacterium]